MKRKVDFNEHDQHSSDTQPRFNRYDIQNDMSLDMRKPVFGVCDQGRLKPAFAATEARQRLEILDIETRGIMLSRPNAHADLRLC